MLSITAQAVFVSFPVFRTNQKYKIHLSFYFYWVRIKGFFPGRVSPLSPEAKQNTTDQSKEIMIMFILVYGCKNFDE
jgi:hypothetical protein